MTDQEILDKILQGRILVNLNTLEVKLYHERWGRFFTKSPDVHPGSGRVRYRFKRDDRRRMIYRNKLVWMYVNHKIVPDGYAIDHIDGNRLNDRPSNLQLQLMGESHKQGNGIQKDKQLKRWSDFFDFIEFMGRVPRDGSPLWS